LKRIMALGTSSFLTQLSIVVVTVVNNILLVRYGAQSIYGADIPLAAFVVIMKLFQIVLNIAIGIASGAQPIVGYNYGAEKYDRVRELLKLIVKWTVIVCLVCTVLFEAFPLVFIRMFGADGELYTHFAVQCLRIYLSLILFTCVQKVCAIFLQSIGHAKAAVPLSILRDALLLVLSFIIPTRMGVTGIFWAAPVADVIALAVTTVVMLRLWKELAAAQNDAAIEAKDAAQTNAEAGAPILRPSKPGVIVTISREHGSAGKQVGQRVAQKLGVPCYYKEMVALAARESGLSKEFISNLNSDENAVMRELYLSTDVVQQAITAQEQAIRQIADAGSCVIVGRAADYVLREYPNVLRVFIYAPTDYRVKKVMEMYGDTQEAGRRSIARSDAARAAYYKNIAGRTWGDPHEYALCVDSSIGIEATADMICAYIARQ
jgi:cytidylate kinase